MKSALIIEDSIVISAFMQEQIRRQRPGTEIALASTLKAGLDYVANHSPELVILDLHLPDADPRDTIGAISRLKAHGAKCIVCTAMDGVEDECRKNGADAVVQKVVGIDTQTLLDTIKLVEA